MLMVPTAMVRHLRDDLRNEMGFTAEEIAKEVLGSLLDERHPELELALRPVGKSGPSSQDHRSSRR
jgi:hypothetical protein